VQNIRRKIADLKKLKAALETMASQYCGGKMPKCPMVDALLMCARRYVQQNLRVVQVQ
jgi:MerR family mercuric resistance operon transcriptional regulator